VGAGFQYILCILLLPIQFVIYDRLQITIAVAFEFHHVRASISAAVVQFAVAKILVELILNNQNVNLNKFQSLH